LIDQEGHVQRGVAGRPHPDRGDDRQEDRRHQVGADQQAPPVPPVDQDPQERAQHQVGEEREQHDPERLLGRAGRLGVEPPLSPERDGLGHGRHHQPLGGLVEPLSAHQEREVAAAE
jgi:hypothetical protein